MKQIVDTDRRLFPGEKLTLLLTPERYPISYPLASPRAVGRQEMKVRCLFHCVTLERDIQLTDIETTSFTGDFLIS